MNYYLAPLEGITGYIYRNAYNDIIHPLDKYFTPFLVPNQNWKLKTKELRDIKPENNQGLTVIPQILTNSARDFIWLAKILEDYGYQEINLNLGCPSKTVVTKGKGAGFLEKTDELDRFLDTIFAKTELSISIKTRIGKESAEEFYELLEIYNRYPLKELIIHPRIQKDFYKNKPNLHIFAYAAKQSHSPLCYNGDIFTIEHFHTFTENFPDVAAIMLGRGIIANPGLINEIKQGEQLSFLKLKEFHDRVCDEYQMVLSGDHNVLFRMKELWNYMGVPIRGNEKGIKRIKKASSLKEYQLAVKQLWALNE